MKHEKHEKNNDVPVVFVDIDETICFYDGERIYERAIPNHDNIAKINKLYSDGCTIVYWTSRGSSQPSNKERLQYLTELTKRQLQDWGALHHRLEMGDKKPLYDIIVDDKAKRIEEL
jgi:phosphatidate phosphatase PAH1